MKSTILSFITLLGVTSVANSATGIWGAYVTVGGTKYKSASSYAGPEPTFNGADLGFLTIGVFPLTLSQGETLTFQNSGHSTFEFALAYRVRLASAAESTNPSDYAFVDMGHGNPIGGGGDEKAEFTGASINLLSGISTPASPTLYAIDIIHKAGAYEGGSNFERLANVNDTNPGGTSWGSTNAFTASFTVVPEPGVTVFALMGSLALLRRRR